ncbi:MAG: O-methyltransferase [Anaerolineales bacterium]
MPVYNDALSEYIQELFASEDEVLRQIREGSQGRGLPPIAVRPEEGRLLQFLAAASPGGTALEVGTLGGYSGTWICRGLPAGSRLITIEKESRHAAVAREHFALAGFTDRVELRVGDAHRLLPGLEAEGPFGFIFIDAEKSGYPAYLKWGLDHLAQGGFFAAHNAFRGGAVADPADQEADNLAIRRFNTALAAASGVIGTIFPAGDGMAIAVRR